MFQIIFTIALYGFHCKFYGTPISFLLSMILPIIITAIAYFIVTRYFRIKSIKFDIITLICMLAIEAVGLVISIMVFGE